MHEHHLHTERRLSYPVKAENHMEWVRQMNACKAQAEEIVKFELIYDWPQDRPEKNIWAVKISWTNYYFFLKSIDNKTWHEYN